MGAMTTATLTPNRRDAAVDVTRWRIERLQAAGYDGEAAIVLALDRDVDLHRAIELLHGGCPHDLALQILL
jgi:hypothetical protein